MITLLQICCWMC